MNKIDEPAIQRMSRNVFALQQTLTNITMTREVALDYARHYFELFFLTPEVSNLILDHYYLLTVYLFPGNIKRHSRERSTIFRIRIHECVAIVTQK